MASLRPISPYHIITITHLCEHPGHLPWPVAISTPVRDIGIRRISKGFGWEMVIVFLDEETGVTMCRGGRGCCTEGCEGEICCWVVCVCVLGEVITQLHHHTPSPPHALSTTHNHHHHFHSHHHPFLLPPLRTMTGAHQPLCTPTAPLASVNLLLPGNTCFFTVVLADGSVT